MPKEEGLQLKGDGNLPRPHRAPRMLEEVEVQGFGAADELVSEKQQGPGIHSNCSPSRAKDHRVHVGFLKR